MNTRILLLFTIIFFGLSAFSQQNDLTIINKYLENNIENYSFKTNDINDIIINDIVDSESKFTSFYIQQRINGIDIFNAISTATIKNNNVVNFANRFHALIENKINVIAPSISPVDAIKSASTILNLDVTKEISLIEESENYFKYKAPSISIEDITAKLVYYPMSESSLKLAWDFSILTLDSKNWYSIRVDALDGEIININDWIIHCEFDSKEKKNNYSDFDFSAPSKSVEDGSSYRVFPLPAESPNHGPYELVTEPADEIASPFGWHDTNGVNGAEYTITRGNNVWAREDTEGDGGMSGADYSPDGGESLTFDFDLNFDQPPAGYQDASITNLFYLNNVMHDIWYQYGFDEASGNFQENNYGNGGVGGDSVNADGQDGDGLNNASFGTPPDGGNPQMTMYEWSGPLGEPLNILDGTLAGGYAAIPAGFGTSLPYDNAIQAELALVVDSPTSSDPYDACESITNGGTLDGKIAVIRRGTCEFGFKILAAQANGAIGVIMVNNVTSPSIITMGEGADDASGAPPSVMISQADGEPLISALESGEVITASLLMDTYNIDGDFDNGIIAHEYGHGISARLVGGPSAVNCFSNDEHMSEGLSDWYGLMITIEEGDQGSDIRGIGTFADGQSTTGNGIRPAPYSTDFSINDYTYGDVSDTSLSQPHGVGFVFATALWDLTWAYIDKYGFDPDFYYGTGGNNIMMQLLLDALKFAPCNPGFLDLRDAILAVDTVSTNGLNQCLIWEVFANRGMGYVAEQGSEFSRVDQVEDFSLPPDNSPSLANCEVLGINDYYQNQIKVYPNPATNFIYVKSSLNLQSLGFEIYDINGRIVKSGEELFNQQLSINISDLSSGLYILNINNNDFETNYKIIIE
jgi:hypothetical protein